MFVIRKQSKILKTLEYCRFVSTKSLIFKNFGEPTDVLEIVEDNLPKPVDDQVLLKVLLAPINPSDINYIQGRYAKKPKNFPAIAGNEFVAEVAAMGEKVGKFVTGEYVMPLQMGLGSWSTHMLVKECNIFPVPDKVDIVQAATMSINPCTAYRMLSDFVKLQPGDCVIQNGANSGVGQAVHQLCNLWGLKSVGIIRDRPSVSVLKQYLTRLGATEVLTDKELKETKIFKECLSKPKLALNCVGGEVAENIAKQMDNYGIMVTYGGMSMQPFRVSAGPLIFRQQRFVGFWLTQWTEKYGNTKAQPEMYQSILDYMSKGKFLAPTVEFIPFHEFTQKPEALALTGFSNRKFIFDMRDYHGIKD